MKKKILVIILIGSLFFLVNGIYSISTISNTTSELDKLIKLHQVEILREHLLIQIKRVQTDLHLKGTRYARGVDTIVNDVMHMGNTVETCFDCHHTPGVTERLLGLKTQIHKYKDTLSRILTMRANIGRLTEEEDAAFQIGEDLITNINTMIVLTTKKLNERTEAALNKIAKTKLIIFILIAAGPVLAGGLGFLLLRRFTKPVNALLRATRKLKAGDLDHAIEPLEDEFGEVAESFNDMAKALKGQMRKIEENEKYYRTLFEKAGDSIFIIDTEAEDKLRITAANKAAAEIHGYTVEEMTAMKITDIDTPDSAEKAPKIVERIMNGEWIKADMMHRKKDGSVFPVEVSAGLLELEGHKYILAFDRDITERKQAEEAQEALQRTEQLRVAGELATGLTHEIKNSLTGIKMSVQVLLQRMSLSEADRNNLLRMLQEIKRIEMLMKDLLNFARPSKLNLVLININSVLDTSITFSLSEDNASKLQHKKISIIKEFESSLPSTMADPMKLQQAFMNLLINSAESMPEGGSIIVKSGYNEQDELIQITIADTGKGIEDKVKDRIFEPFFTTKPTGTGLGLPITKRLIEQHGGTISVEKADSGGALFRIAIPLKQNHEYNIS
jgi:two-component system, NtrC family, sensor histidine kinase AtoS